MSRSGRWWLGLLLRDEDGATLVTAAMLLTVLVGFLGLGLDLGYAYTAQRAAQNAADSAALTAAVARQAGANDLDAEAKAIAAQYGIAESKKVSIRVNSPPESGPNAADSDAVEVVITQPRVGFFSTIFTPSRDVPDSFTARAVARAGSAGGCMLVLNRTVTSVIMNGTMVLNMPTCALYANSAGAPAVIINGGDVVNALGLYAVGTVLQNGTVTINPSGAVHAGAKPMADPYADLTMPGYSGCDSATSIPLASYKASGQRPFVFCNGLIVNTGTVRFGPGVYVFNGGTFIVNAGSVTGDNVTFVLTNGASMTFNSGSDIDLKAPTSGAMSGVLFYMDPKTTATPVTLNAASAQTYRGAMYFPKSLVTLNGGTDVSGSDCTQVIADRLILNGGIALNLACTASGMRPIGGASRLVE